MTSGLRLGLHRFCCDPHNDLQNPQPAAHVLMVGDTRWHTCTCRPIYDIQRSHALDTLPNRRSLRELVGSANLTKP